MQLYFGEEARARFVTRLLVVAGAAEVLVHWLERDAEGVSKAFRDPDCTQARALASSLGQAEFSIEQYATALGCAPATVRAALLGLATGMPSGLCEAHAEAKALQREADLTDDEEFPSSGVLPSPERMTDAERDWFCEQLEEAARREEALCDDVQRERERRLAASRTWKSERAQWREATLWCLERLRALQPTKPQWLQGPTEKVSLIGRLLASSAPEGRPSQSPGIREERRTPGPLAGAERDVHPD